MKRIVWLLLVLLPGFLAYGCWVKSPFYGEFYGWHQRIAAEVGTPHGPVSSAVVQGVEATYYPNGLFATGTEVEATRTGEALVIDLGAELGQRRYLFALLPSLGVASVTVRHLRDERRDKGTLFGQIEDQIGKAPTEFDGLQWVGFEDFEDPKTVFSVNPKDLTASYGEGYALTRLTLQITDDPLTEGEVEKVLGWLCDYKKRGARLSGSTSIAVVSNDLPEVLGTGSFRIGECS